MQNRVYSRYIYQMLMEHGSVAVPEMGTFYLRKNSAKFNENHQKLFPPSTGVYFSPNADKDFQFSSLLIESGLKNEEAELLEKLITEDYKSPTQNSKIFELDNLGSISNEIFTEKENDTFNRFIGLKELNISAIPKGTIIHDEKFDYYLNQKATKTKSNFKKLIWPILIGLFTTICIVLWFLSDSEPNQTKSIRTQPIETPLLPTENNDSIYEQIDNTIIENKLKTDSAIPSEIEKPEKTKTQSNNKGIADSPLKECIVIVGTFTQPENAARLVKKIKSKGYKPYRQAYNGMTRVGVLYDCAIHQPDVYKEKMKRIFNPDAWHLHDTL